MDSKQKTPGKRRFTVVMKITTIVIIMAALIGTSAIYASYHLHSTTMNQYYKEQVVNIGKTVSRNIPSAYIEVLKQTVDNPEFESVRNEALEKERPELLKEWLVQNDVYDDYEKILTILEDFRENMCVSDVYILDTQPGFSTYLADPDEEITILGQRENNAAEFEAYTGNQEILPTVSEGEYGWLCSGYEPVYSESGEAIALIGVDISMDEMVARQMNFLRQMLTWLIVLTVIIVILIICYFRYTLTKPLQRLARSAQTFVSRKEEEGTADQTQTAISEITIKSNDEIRDLYDSIRQMETDIHQYIQNITAVTAEKERIGAELSIATQIQSSMLPCIFPPFPNRAEFDIYASMTPAKEVGGDFYDFFMVDDRHIAIVMADVSGKGVPAALFMVIGKTLIKDHTQPGMDLGDIFSKVNDLLCESNSEDMFITAFEGVLDLVTGEFRYVNAGHEMPFIRKKGADFEAYKIRPGFVLAGMEGMRYKAGSMMLEPGDMVFQYTDGVTEATNAQNELFGMDRLQAALNSVKENDTHAILTAVKDSIDTFVGDAPQFDDITMLCLDYKEKMEVDAQ